MKVKSKYVKHCLHYMLICSALVFYLFPIYWLIITSLKFPGDVTASPVVWFTTKLTLDNYRLLFGHTGALWGAKQYVGRSFLPSIAPYITNSIMIGVLSSGFGLLLGALLAYGIVRFRIGGSRLYNWLLSLRMIPPVVVAIPMFTVFRTLGLIDTWWAVASAHLLMSIPFSTLLLIGFFSDIPGDIMEAALLDGCTNLGAFSRVVLPLAAPGLVAVFIIAFLTSWNELLIANVLTTTAKAQTFPVYTTSFAQVERGTAWGPAAAGGVIGMVPMLISSFYIQRYLVRGLTMGAVKE
ncbi:MAG TPA: carbohydrate ABC transporter permease [Firmicutes bacterium]|nr:carbohydrate ABC transporter permease [Bacillota bacterium]